MSQDLLSSYLLVVADKVNARDELALTLATLATAKVTEAASLAAAAAELHSPDRRIDLVIIDLEMADSAAVTLTRKLRDPLAFRARNVSVLLIGGAVNTPHYAAAVRLGIQGHLPRPLTSERLRQAVRAALLARPTEAPPRPAERSPGQKPAVVAEIVTPEPPQPYVPVANKPFRHGLQSLMRTIRPIDADEAFGFEPAPVVRRPAERKSASYDALVFPGRRLSAVT